MAQRTILDTSIIRRTYREYRHWISQTYGMCLCDVMFFHKVQKTGFLFFYTFHENKFSRVVNDYMQMMDN